MINWQLITENKRKQIACDNARENTERIPHQYKIGDEVLRIKKGVKRKYSKHKSDLYKIINVHTNGTVTIAQGVKHQNISIRNIELVQQNVSDTFMRTITYLTYQICLQ